MSVVGASDQPRSPRLRPSWIIGAAASVLLVAGARAQLGAPPVPPQNPITEAKRVLGKVLFWDEQLSTSNVVACATCHIPARAGTDPRRAQTAGADGILGNADDVFGSPGVVKSDFNNDFERDLIHNFQPQVTGRSAPSMINAAYFADLFWDGRARSSFDDPQTGENSIPAGGALESQAVGPLLNSVEMAHADYQWSSLTGKLAHVRPLEASVNLPPDLASALGGGPSYPELFRRAFGDDAITADRIGKAIATYERTLISDQTPYDRFRRGETAALTPQQAQGLNAFVARACVTCHTEPLFADPSPTTGFRNLGVRPVAQDAGRSVVTGNAADRGKFKTPSLRNVNLKTSFMHTGEFTSLPQVMTFYVQGAGVPAGSPLRENRDPLMDQMNPQTLPPQVVQNILAFLNGGLTDPRVVNETFPFDRPTLFQDRPASVRASNIGGGVAGSAGITPGLIVQGPPMLGSSGLRVGVINALGGAQARLGISNVAPVAGRITPVEFLVTKATSGSGAGGGLATHVIELSPTKFAQGETWYMQWFITDPGAAGGQALSAVAQVPIICGAYGCPSLACNVADVTGVGGAVPADGLLTVDDLIEFVNAFSSGDGCPGLGGAACNVADLCGIGGPPEAPDGQLTIDDLIAFVNAFSEGC